MTGVVRWWADNKGLGFIRGTDGRDYFVHYSAVEGRGRKNLERDEDVEFQPTHTERGPRAMAVRRKVAA